MPWLQTLADSYLACMGLVTLGTAAATPASERALRWGLAAAGVLALGLAVAGLVAGGVGA